MWLERREFGGYFAQWWKYCNFLGWEGYKLLSKNMEVFGDKRVEKINLMGRLEVLDGFEASPWWSNQLK